MRHWQHLHVLSTEYVSARRRRRTRVDAEWLPIFLAIIWKPRQLILRREPRLYNRSWIADILSHDEQRYTSEEFRADFRLQRRSFAHLCGRLLPHWETTIGGGRPRVPIDVALLIFLYRLGSTVTQRTLARLFGYERGHVGQLTSQMGEILTTHCSDWIRCPDTPEEWKEMSQRWNRLSTYLWNIIGVMDGTLIPIMEPLESTGEYVCRKGFHVYNVQALCDERGLFMDICIGVPGSQNDQGVLYLSEFYNERVRSVPEDYYILADGGYALQTWLLAPYNINARNTVEQTAFNKQLSSQRVKVEQAFGRVKARWRKIATRMEMRNQTFLQHSIAAAFLLHNFCERAKDELTADEWQEALVIAAQEHEDNEAAVAEERNAAACAAIRDNYADKLWERMQSG